MTITLSWTVKGPTEEQDEHPSMDFKEGDSDSILDAIQSLVGKPEIQNVCAKKVDDE